MKICFVLQRRFAFIGHVMACQIKELAPETEFCGLVQHRPSLDFIQNQTDITYTSILFDEDIFRTIKDEKIDYEYLNNVEREYGIPNLWPFLYIDRVLMNGQLVREYPYDKALLSHEDMLRCTQVYAKTIIAFLEKEKPDAIVISVVGSIASTMLYHFAQKKGIQTINMDFARIGNRIALSEDDRTFTWARDRFTEIQGGAVSPLHEEAKRFLKKFREAPAPYDAEYMGEFYGEKKRFSIFKFLHPSKLAKSIPWHAKILISDFKKRKNADYMDIFIWWSLWDKLKRKTRTFIGFSDLYTKPDMNERFAYFPLHIEPEIAIMRYAPYYTDQRAVIRAIAHALPIDMFLYVKEHPGMDGYRTRQFFKDIAKIPNVRVINPYVKGNELARNAAITIVITSTGAWESLMMNKPVLTFGDVYFNDVPGVKRVRGFEELPYLIKEQLEEWKPNDEALINYIAALMEESVSVDFSKMWNEAASTEIMRNDEGMKNLSRTLAEKIGIIKAA